VTRRIAFYGGSFDPVHDGHVAISRALIKQFSLDEFVFIPAFHAPHKPHRKPTSPFHRYAMLALATNDIADVRVSTMEVELPEKPYTVETLARLTEKYPGDAIFFVMGADSWMEITTWREWEKVLTMSNHIVVTRPGVEIGLGHITGQIRERVTDLRGGVDGVDAAYATDNERKIYISDAVNLDISSTEIRNRIRSDSPDRWAELQQQVAKYIEKYQIYK
jgi:nicotinate-nucleotide adenylyltransferase